MSSKARTITTVRVVTFEGGRWKVPVRWVDLPEDASEEVWEWNLRRANDALGECETVEVRDVEDASAITGTHGGFFVNVELLKGGNVVPVCTRWEPLMEDAILLRAELIGMFQKISRLMDGVPLIASIHHFPSFPRPFVAEEHIRIG